MTKTEIFAEMKRRLEDRVYVGMHNTVYHQTAVEVMFDVAAEVLAEPLPVYATKPVE
jgi:hypothetical protein